MQSLLERALVNEDSDVQELRELAVDLTVEGDEPGPRIMTDGGRPAPRPAAGWRSPLGGPRYGATVDERHDDVEKWDEERIQAEIEKRREARAVAGPEDEHVRADGGLEEATQEDVEEAVGNSHASAVNAQLSKAAAEGTLPELDVGDHVEPENSDTTTVVIRDCEESAGEYWFDAADETVAEYNGCDPDEAVYQVAFAGRGDGDLADLERYPYPRSRLELVEPLHDRDTTNGGDSNE